MESKSQYPPAFVTYGWCRSAYAVVQSLGQKAIDVHVGDNSPLAMSRGSRYRKSFTCLPLFFNNPHEYFERTLQAVRKTGSKVLLPCHEDIEIFLKRRSEIQSDVYLPAPSADVYAPAEDKLK